MDLQKIKDFQERVLELKLQITNYKIKQDERNKLNEDFKEMTIELFEMVGFETQEVTKALGIKLDNIGTRTPNGYIPAKIQISFPSVDFDIDFENEFLESEKQRKKEEAEQKAKAKAEKKKRDAEERKRLKELKAEKIAKQKAE